MNPSRPRRQTGSWSRRGVGAVVALAMASACTSAAGTGRGAERATIAAAASLSAAFDRIGAQLRAANPRAQVRFDFGASSTLAAQVVAGAPAEVLVTADLATMQTVQHAGLLDGRPVRFAQNRLTVVTKPGNPEHLRTVADLAREGVVALCAPEVPCGRYAAAVLDRARVHLPEPRVTRAPDAETTLGQVVRGDADAAIVYVTDARAAGRAVTTVPIPAADNVVADYWVALLHAGRHNRAARAFVTFLASRAGRRTMRDRGFVTP